MYEPFHLLTNYRFIVLCNDIMMGFNKISGISRHIGVETYQEGGLNTTIHAFPKAVDSEHTLTLEKGCYMGISHPFYLVGERINSMRIEVINSIGIPMKSYQFSGVFVKSWETGELNAQTNSLLIDKFELAYEYFYEAEF